MLYNTNRFHVYFPILYSFTTVSFFLLVVFAFSLCLLSVSHSCCLPPTPICFPIYLSPYFLYSVFCDLHNANILLCPPESHRCAEHCPPSVLRGCSAYYSGGCGSDHVPVTKGTSFTYYSLCEYSDLLISYMWNDMEDVFVVAPSTASFPLENVDFLATCTMNQGSARQKPDNLAHVLHTVNP